MARFSVVLALVGVVALGSGLPWREALHLNIVRVAHTRAVLASGDRRESLAESVRLAAASLNAGASSSRTYALAGSVARTDMDASATIDALTRAVELDAYDDVSREFLADALFRSGDIDGAATHWRAARAGKMVRRRAWEAMGAGDSRTGLAYLQARTRVEANDSDAWLELGDAYLDRRDIDAARATYGEIIARWPERALGYARLAELYYFRLGRPELATPLLDKAIAKAPGPELYAVRSQIAAHQGRYADAEADARRTLSLAPTNATYLLRLGDLLHVQNRYDEAVEQYSRALEESTDPTVAWHAPLRQGRTLTAAGRLGEAVSAYETAVAAGAAHPVSATALAEYYVLLGEACLRIDRVSRARWAFAQAKNHDPSNVSAANHLKSLDGR